MTATRSRISRIVTAACLAVALTLAGAGGAAAASARDTVPAQAIGKCDQVGSQKAPKTRFLLHAGFAFGAFHRYIYGPLKSGGFSSGASSRTKTIVKAVAAGAFVLRELVEMDKFANADKTLCKIVPSISGVSAGATDLVSKLRSGSASTTDVTNAGSLFDNLQSQASTYGAQIKDKAAKIPGL